MVKSLSLVHWSWKSGLDQGWSLLHAKDTKQCYCLCISSVNIDLWKTLQHVSKINSYNKAVKTREMNNMALRFRFVFSGCKLKSKFQIKKCSYKSFVCLAYKNVFLVLITGYGLLKSYWKDKSKFFLAIFKTDPWNIIHFFVSSYSSRSHWADLNLQENWNGIQ